MQNSNKGKLQALTFRLSCTMILCRRHFLEKNMFSNIQLMQKLRFTKNQLMLLLFGKKSSTMLGKAPNQEFCFGIPLQENQSQIVIPILDIKLFQQILVAKFRFVLMIVVVYWQ